MNKTVVSGLALLLLVSGVSAFYFAPFDFSSAKRFQPRLNTVPFVVLTPSFSVVLNDVSRVALPNRGGFADEVRFTINSNQNVGFRTTVIYNRNGEEIRANIGQRTRGENRFVVPNWQFGRPASYAVEICYRGGCTTSNAAN